MIILAHRGIQESAPENTLPAFENALTNGFGIETDLRLTADDRFVIQHDRSLNRVSGVDVNVDELYTQELKRLNLSDSEDARSYEVPTLEEVLDLFTSQARPSAKLALHLKISVDKTVATHLVDVLTRYNRQTNHDLLGKTVVFDVTLKVAREIKRANPAIQVGLSIGESDYFPRPNYPTLYTYESVQNIDCWDIAWADEWNGGLYTSDCIRQIQNDGKTVICVSPELHMNTDPSHPKASSPAEIWQHLRQCGVDGICTDSPVELSKIHE